MELWRLNLLYILAVLAVIFGPLIYSGTPLPFHQSDRAVGGSLDGNWYYADDGGCFDDGSFRNFRDGKLYMRGARGEIEYGIEVASVTLDDMLDADPDFRFKHLFSNPNGLIATMQAHASPPSLPDDSLVVFFQDEGSALRPQAISISGTLITLTDEFAALKREWNIRRCTNPTFWGLVQTLWRRKYYPDRQYRLLQLKK